MKRVLLLLSAALAALSVSVSAYGKDDWEQLTGKWQMAKISGKPSPCSLQDWYEFRKEGNDFYYSYYIACNRVLTKGQLVVNETDNTLVMTPDGFPFPFEYDVVSVGGAKLVMKYLNVTYTLKKVK